MLVCSCNFITEKEIEDTIVGLLDEDCWQLIVPAKVYHAMENAAVAAAVFPMSSTSSSAPPSNITPAATRRTPIYLIS